MSLSAMLRHQSMTSFRLKGDAVPAAVFQSLLVGIVTILCTLNAAASTYTNEIRSVKYDEAYARRVRHVHEDSFRGCLVVDHARFRIEADMVMESSLFAKFNENTLLMLVLT